MYFLAVPVAVVIILFPELRISGKNAISYNMEGWSCLERGDHLRAIFSFRNALKENARYQKALVGLGYAYYEVEAYEQAVELFADSLKIDGRSHEALTGMGFSLIGLGKLNQALLYFNQAITISGEDLKAHYGIAYLYYVMGKMVWAERKIASIFKVDPYHLDSLLLMALIKEDNGRLDEARGYTEKAIGAASENPKGHVAHGRILLQEYLKKDNSAYLPEAVHSLKSALSIQPNNFWANRLMGDISLITGRYAEAVEYYRKTGDIHQNGTVLYNMAVAQDRAGSRDEAMKTFLRAYKLTSSDSILRSRLEEFLVLHDYKIGHPVRTMFSNDHFTVAMEKEKQNLPDEAVMYLRRVLLLNPMNREARESLMAYYDILGYHRLYIDELKDMNRLYQSDRYRDRLSAEIIKRRNKLYHREGYSTEEPPRDVPVVLVMDFYPSTGLSQHIDTGHVFAGSLTFSLGQFGRMNVMGMRTRESFVAGLKTSPSCFEESLGKINELIKSKDLKAVDYIIYGSYRENGNSVSVECNIMDFHKGVIIGTVDLSEGGRESLPVLALRVSRRIYDMIPFTGRILKLKEKGVIVNIGLYDGIKPGSMIVLQKITGSSDDVRKIRKKYFFTVKESDTLLSYAEPIDKNDLDDVDSSDTVYPYKRRRARLID